MSNAKGDHGPCAIENCPNQRRQRSEICANCAANNHYWERKIEKFGPQVVRERQQSLAKWQYRMLYWGSHADQPRRVVNAIRVIPRRPQ